MRKINTVNAVQVNVIRAMLKVDFDRQYVTNTDTGFTITYTGVKDLPRPSHVKLENLIEDLSCFNHMEAALTYENGKVSIKAKYKGE
jgi:hypothetical protein